MISSSDNSKTWVNCVEGIGFLPNDAMLSAVYAMAIPSVCHTRDLQRNDLRDHYEIYTT